MLNRETDNANDEMWNLWERLFDGNTEQYAEF